MSVTLALAGELKIDFKMKKIISFVILIFLTLNFLASPFYILNIKEKVSWVTNKSEFTKNIIKIDSVKISSEGAGPGATTSQSDILDYYFYYDKGKYINMQDNSKSLFPSKNKIRKTTDVINYLENHNDSLLIWYHPKINGQIACKEDKVMNTKGFLMQILLNLLSLLVAISSLMWLIIKIRNKKNEEA